MLVASPQLLNQPALPEARRAFDQHDRPLSGRRAIHEALERRQRPLAPDEQGCEQLPGLAGLAGGRRAVAVIRQQR